MAPTETRRIYAGFWLRLAAALLDCVVLLFPYCFVTSWVVAVWRFASATNEVGAALVILRAWLLIVATWLYFALLESSLWQATIGKKAFGLYVTDIEGRRLTLSRATGRTFAKYLSSMTAGVGFVICGLTTKKQALHDLVANCLVLSGRPPFGE
jgi:uncharacterized RDD family membrane protein YckC